MRFLVHEKGYERLRVRGAYRYAYADEPTSAIEIWRLTATAAGDLILRIDLDGRPGDGASTLFHAILTADLAPVRVTYRRLLADGGRIAGNLLADGGMLTNSRTLADAHYVEELAQLPLLLPSVAGLGWLQRQMRAADGSAFAVLNHADDLPAGQLRLTALDGGWHAAPELAQTVHVGPTPHATTAATLRWGDQTRTLWCDVASGWPLMMARGDGLRAWATHIMVS